MQFRGRRLVGWFALTALIAGCDIGGCGGCVEPLPPGVEVPPDQTVEGGAQIRLTPTGFSKITDLIPAVLNDTLADGFCLDEGDQGIGIGSIDWCYQNDGTCVDGCQADFNVDFINVTVPNNQVLNLRTQFDIDVDVPIRFDPIIGGDLSCNMDATASNSVIDADITFSINPATGELQLDLENIGDLDVNLNVSGCGLVSSIIDVVADAIFGALSVGFIRDLIQPLLNDLVQGFLPNPLGLEGMLSATGLLPGVAPETNANIEMRLVAGGYVFLEGNGMSLGMISGINADEDQSTRGVDLDSEPALCVPPIPAPDFAAPPASLSTSVRGNFNLLPAGAFRGAPDPAGTDLIIGASETALDQLGHHLVTSGGMCLGVGTELVAPLNLGTFGLLVPSLSELGNDDDPMLLVTRPQSAVDFTVGEGTSADPAITMSLRNFEIDFYAFIFERYTRAFTVALTLDIGINLEFALDANGDPAVIPMLVGLDAASIGIEVANADFIREPAADIEAILPDILDALLPQLTGGLDPIALPEFAGFALTNLAVTKVTTPEDDFVAISAELGASQGLVALGSRYPSVAAMVADMPVVPTPVPSTAGASLRSVVVPKPAVIRAGLIANDSGKLPTISIDVDTHDAEGRALEWAWNIDGGIWRPFRSGSPLLIADKAFALQGPYTIELIYRVVGDYTTTSIDPIAVPVVIDSAPPRIYSEKVSLKDGAIVIPVTDLVSDLAAVEIAYGTAGALEPTTAWTGLQPLSITGAKQLAGEGEIVRIFARDERGNSIARDIDLGDLVEFHGAGDDAGCECDSSGQSTGSILGSLFVFGFALLLIAGPTRRRRLVRVLPILVGLLGLSMASACSCGSSGDDPLECPVGEVVTCFGEEGDETCTCTEDVPFGNIGKYSEMTVAADSSYWVSAYNETHGDLMVANVRDAGRIADESWAFIDGVPDGPAIPGLSVRGGVRLAGDDVGQYTDIAVAPSGRVMVSYFSQVSGGLQVAINEAGTWTTHPVDEGVLGDIETGFEVAGQYSAIGLRGDDERPMIAYFVSIGELGERRTELRLARSMVASPVSASDWTIETIEATPVPETEETDILTIPKGSGLFVNLVVRPSDNEPILAYYDRLNGDLKLAQMVDAAFAVEVIDGVNVDVGWYPGIAIDSSDIVHLSYVSASSDDMLYINTADRVIETVDNGHRIVGTTEDGLPKPEFHFVGDDSSVVLTAAGPIVVYQDATTHELLVAGKNGAGNWIYETIAGNEDPFVGGYGFYASAAPDGPQVAMSTYVVDQPNDETWVEVFVQQVIIE